jgi:hypothetical protein
MVDSSARLGRHRWTIERTGAWLGGLRRLRIRYERSSERFNALVMLACSGICFITLRQRHGEPFPERPGNPQTMKTAATPPLRSAHKLVTDSGRGSAGG